MGKTFAAQEQEPQWDNQGQNGEEYDDWGDVLASLGSMSKKKEEELDEDAIDMLVVRGLSTPVPIILLFDKEDGSLLFR